MDENQYLPQKTLSIMLFFLLISYFVMIYFFVQKIRYYEKQNIERLQKIDALEKDLNHVRQPYEGADHHHTLLAIPDSVFVGVDSTRVDTFRRLLGYIKQHQ